MPACSTGWSARLRAVPRLRAHHNLHADSSAPGPPAARLWSRDSYACAPYCHLDLG